MSGDISKFLDEQRHYILEEKRRLGIIEKTQSAEKEVGNSYMKLGFFVFYLCYYRYLFILSK